jgi:hypothetical protein
MNFSSVARDSTETTKSLLTDLSGNSIEPEVQTTCLDDQSIVKLTGSLHANRLNFVIETSKHATHWLDTQWKSMGNNQTYPYWTCMGRDKTGKQDSFPSHANLRNLLERDLFNTWNNLPQSFFNGLCKICGG